MEGQNLVFCVRDESCFTHEYTSRSYSLLGLRIIRPHPWLSGDHGENES